MIKKKNKITIFVSLALMGIIGYALLDSPHHHHSHDEHHHDHHDHDGHDDDEEASNFVAFNEEQTHKHGIKIEEASSGAIEKTILINGKVTVNENQHAHLVPKVSGIALSTNKNIGETVQEGEVLALIESREMAEAKANYLAALKKESLTKETWNRENRLHTNKITSTRELETAKGDHDHALIDLQLAEQKLYALGLNKDEILGLPAQDPAELRIYTMRAPFAGTIIDKHITQGEFIQTDHETYVLSNLNEVWGELNLYPSDLSKISKKQKVEIIGPSGNIAIGEIIYLNPVIDEETRTAKAIALIENSEGKWHPGSFIHAKLLAPGKEAPTRISKSAIQKIDGQEYVFIPVEGGFEIRAVEIGDADDRYIEILHGLEQGEKLAADNTFILKAELKKDEAEHEH